MVDNIFNNVEKIQYLDITEVVCTDASKGRSGYAGKELQQKNNGLTQRRIGI